MATISNQLTIIASVLFFGYSLSLSTNGYKAICKKAAKFRELLQMEVDAVGSVRKTNFLLTSTFSLVYLTLLYFSGFAYWFIASILVKLMVTIVFSDTFQCAVINKKEISKRFYLMMKSDSIANTVLGLMTPILIVF